jgi:hypothetical protein
LTEKKQNKKRFNQNLNLMKYTQPKIYHYNYDIKKAWMVAFRYEGKQYQIRGDINRFKTKKQRLVEAK